MSLPTMINPRTAGLILKNSLDAMEAGRKQELLAGWVLLDPNVKGQIKAALSQTLFSLVVDARHTVALVIAKIAAIELPQGEWPELVGNLLSNMGPLTGAAIPFEAGNPRRS
jgi:importin subunit beta-1